MAQFLLAFLGAFGLVLFLGATFVFVYRRHVRHWRAVQRVGDGMREGMARRLAMTHGLPPRWMVIRSSNTYLIRETLRVPQDLYYTWMTAMERVRERRLFVSQPVEGWTLVIGEGLPDPAVDVDACYRFLTWVSRECGEVQFFSVDRVLSYHGWARIRDGKVVRAYAWSGETQWNEGKVTLDERLLGMTNRGYGESVEPLAYGEKSPEQVNCERVVLLARRWGMDPLTAAELLYQGEPPLRSDDERSGAS